MELYLPEGWVRILAGAYVVVQVAALLTTVHAAMYARSAQGSTAWIIGLIAAPLVALPLYAVFGRNRFRGYIDARRSADQQHHWINEHARHFCDDHRAVPEAQYLGFLAKLAHLPFTSGNRVELLIDGAATFDSIFRAIEGARDYVLLQFFIVRDDVFGRELKDLLIRRAQAGVRVYFLIDQFGSRQLRSRYVRELLAASVRVVIFRSTRRFTTMQVNFRNHRKIVVVDGSDAWVGGLNIGDEYLGRVSSIGRWRDTCVRLRGPSADAVQLIFAEDWHWATGETIDALDWAVQREDDDATAIVIASGPADGVETCNLMFLQLLGSARERFWIASPYFVPNAEIIAAMQLAVMRGVDVRVLLPAHPDHIVVHLASLFYERLVHDMGVRFYRYRDGFLHQKVFVCDDACAGVGTANLDNRSLRLNFEVTVIATHAPTIRATAAMLESDFAASHLVTGDDITARNGVVRLLAAMSRLLAPVL